MAVEPHRYGNPSIRLLGYDPYWSGRVICANTPRTDEQAAQTPRWTEFRFSLSSRSDYAMEATLHGANRRSYFLLPFLPIRHLLRNLPHRAHHLC